MRGADVQHIEAELETARLDELALEVCFALLGTSLNYDSAAIFSASLRATRDPLSAPAMPIELPFSTMCGHLPVAALIVAVGPALGRRPGHASTGSTGLCARLPTASDVARWVEVLSSPLKCLARL